jgi:hypothetical protein
MKRLLIIEDEIITEDDRPRVQPLGLASPLPSTALRIRSPRRSRRHHHLRCDDAQAERLRSGACCAATRVSPASPS